MSELKSCARCGAMVPVNLLNGHCPHCLSQFLLVLPPLMDEAVSSLPLALRRFVGDFELIEEIARGGMGVVYRARQISLKRLVALKMIIAGEFASPQMVRRFRFEAEAAAHLQHPNIVAIHEVGEHEGQHYLAMDLVEGCNLAELVRDQPLPARRAAYYLKTIAEAIHYAHEKGILHRDLKPSNILIDPFDQPRITDFGLAKQFKTDSTLSFTNQALGSPAFMPPEQAASQSGATTPASDVYSLGAILYYLLTGRSPFQGENLAQLLLQVQNTEPIAPRLLNPGISVDVEIICLKCLEKEPSRRYQTAQALAQDLDRFLHDQPILARPVGRPEKLWRWCRRNRALAGTLAALAVALSVGVVSVLWLWQRAEASDHKTRLNLYAADIKGASLALDQGDLGLAIKLLEAHRPNRHEEDLRGFEWWHLWQRCQGQQHTTFHGHHLIIDCLAFSPDSERVASGSQDGTIRLWNTKEQKPLFSLSAHTGAVWSVSFTPQGDKLISSGSDHQVKSWDLETRQSHVLCEGDLVVLSPKGSVMAVANSSLLFWEPGGKICLWDYRAQRKLRELSQPGKTMAFSSDGRFLAVAGPQRGITIWNTANGENIQSIHSEVQVWSPAFSPNGKQLIAATRRQVLVWNLANPTGPAVLPHTLTVWSAGFAPDGKTIVTAESDRGVRLWDAASLRLQGTLWGHADEVWCAAFSPDGKTIATAGKDRTVRLWESQLASAPIPLPHTVFERPLFSPDGSRLVTTIHGTNGRQSTLWDTVQRTPLAMFKGNHVLGFSTDGRQLLCLSVYPPSVEFWSFEREAVIKVVRLDFKNKTPYFDRTGISGNGKFIFGLGTNHVMEVFDASTGRSMGAWSWWRPGEPIPPSHKVRCILLSPDGKRLAASFEEEHSVRLYEVESGHVTRLAGHRDFISGIAFSPDGKQLATGSVDATIKLWDVATAKELAMLTGHMEEATDVTFSPDGRTLVSIATQSEIKFWHLPTRRELVSLAMPHAGFHLQFDPQGRHIAATLGLDDNEQVQLLSVLERNIIKP